MPKTNSILLWNVCREYLWCILFFFDLYWQFSVWFEIPLHFCVCISFVCLHWASSHQYLVDFFLYLTLFRIVGWDLYLKRPSNIDLSLWQLVSRFLISMDGGGFEEKIIASYHFTFMGGGAKLRRKYQWQKFRQLAHACESKQPNLIVGNANCSNWKCNNVRQRLISFSYKTRLTKSVWICSLKCFYFHFLAIWQLKSTPSFQSRLSAETLTWKLQAHQKLIVSRYTSTEARLSRSGWLHELLVPHISIRLDLEKSWRHERSKIETWIILSNKN